MELIGETDHHLSGAVSDILKNGYDGEESEEYDEEGEEEDEDEEEEEDEEEDDRE